MKIEISDSALAWFKEEVGIKPGDRVKFYTQIYGSSPIQPGFSLAFTKDDTATDIATKTVTGGITFFVRTHDEWFFKGGDLVLDFDESVGELVFGYTAL